MEIVKYPDSILFTPCQPVTDFKAARKLSEDMFNFMKGLYWGTPVGLAANQVGHSQQIFWALDQLYINPKVTLLGSTRQVNEGCYSLEQEKFDYPVKRYAMVEIEWYDKKGKSHKAKFGGYQAQVIQHEYDHLMGKLCSGDKAVGEKPLW